MAQEGTKPGKGKVGPMRSIASALDGQFGAHEIGIAVKAGADAGEICIKVCKGIAEGRCQDDPVLACEVAIRALQEVEDEGKSE